MPNSYFCPQVLPQIFKGDDSSSLNHLCMSIGWDTEGLQEAIVRLLDDCIARDDLPGATGILCIVEDFLFRHSAGTITSLPCLSY